MLHALHQAGHKYLKLLFVVVLAGSSTLFFIGAAIPKPPALLVVVIGAGLGIALEWSYFTVSCDLTQSISKGNKGGIARDLLYTIIGGVASWFLFSNAALRVGWATADDLLGLSRKSWAMIMALIIVLVIFALSARRERPKHNSDLQAMARSISIMLPDASPAVQLQLLSAIASEAAKHAIAMPTKQQALPAPAGKTSTPASAVPPGQAITADFRTLQPGESEAANNGHGTFRQA